MLEVVFDHLELPLNAAEVLGSGLHERLLGTRRGCLFGALLQVHVGHVVGVDSGL